MIAFLAWAVMSAAQPLPSIDEFMAAFQEKRDKLQSVRAELRQENITGGDSEVVNGSIFYANPRRLIFRYPEEKLAYLFDDQHVYHYDAEAQQVEVRDLSQQPDAEALFVGFGESPERLREFYNIELFRPDASECGSIGMILRPRVDPEEAPFEEVRLYLREEDYLPCRVITINDSESRTLYDIQKYDVNSAFRPQDTQLNVPEGTDVYQNDQYRETAGPGGLWLPEEPLRPKNAVAAS